MELVHQDTSVRPLELQLLRFALQAISARKDLLLLRNARLERITQQQGSLTPEDALAVTPVTTAL